MINNKALLFRFPLIITICAYLLLQLSACTTGPAVLLVGKWKQDGRNIVLEFQSNSGSDSTTNNADNSSGELKIICEHITINGAYKFKYPELTLYPELVSDECFEDYDEDHPDPSTFQYIVEELTEARMVLSSVQTPSLISEYHRVK